jgi:hypothetical protein
MPTAYCASYGLSYRLTRNWDEWAVVVMKIRSSCGGDHASDSARSPLRLPVGVAIVFDVDLWTGTLTEVGCIVSA